MVAPVERLFFQIFLECLRDGQKVFAAQVHHVPIEMDRHAWHIEHRHTLFARVAVACMTG